MINNNDVIDKFGVRLIANDDTYRLGIGIWFSDHLAKRFSNRIVLETCSGGGFTTIWLSKYAKYVYSFEIDEERINDAKQNCIIAGNIDRVRFINDSIYNIDKYGIRNEINAAFIDPDWNNMIEKYIYRFKNSMTRPPSDELLSFIQKITKNITLIQPPHIANNEFEGIGTHRIEELYLNNEKALLCVHLGDLIDMVENDQYFYSK